MFQLCRSGASAVHDQAKGPGRRRHPRVLGDPDLVVAVGRRHQPSCRTGGHEARPRSQHCAPHQHRAAQWPGPSTRGPAEAEAGECGGADGQACGRGTSTPASLSRYASPALSASTTAPSAARATAVARFGAVHSLSRSSEGGAAAVCWTRHRTTVLSPCTVTKRVPGRCAQAGSRAAAVARWRRRSPHGDKTDATIGPGTSRCVASPSAPHSTRRPPKAPTKAPEAARIRIRITEGTLHFFNGGARPAPP